MLDNHNRDDPPDRLLSRILEAAIIIAASGWLVRLGICYIQEVLPTLLILAALVGVGIIVWRIRRHHRNNRL